MAEFNINNSTTTNFANTVPDFVVNAKALDAQNSDKQTTYWYFTEATAHFGYYFSVAEIYSAANALATWAFGNGWETEDPQMKAILEHVIGMGKDTFTKIIYNHEIVKLIVGDAFIEVKKKDNVIINMIPISPERVRIKFNKNGMIENYSTWNGTDWRVIAKENMIHSHNKRIGDQLHGTSQLTATKNVTDTLNEAREDERIIKHRDKALGIAYYKTNNTGKITYANEQIEKAVKNGEMVGLPENTVKIEQYPSKSSEDRQNWIQYNENFFYQVFGVPRSVATSDGTSEVGGKMGNVNFEPTYAKEVNDMEEDLWNQQGIKVSFIRQDKLGGLQETEQKNTGQTRIQPNDVEASMTRE